MGMTIDKAIEHGKEQLEIFGGEHNEFIQTAIDTMRKYKKIKQIVDHWACCGNPSDSMIAISEVLEDGNVD